VKTLFVLTPPILALADDAPARSAPQASAPLQLEIKLPLGNVKGRIGVRASGKEPAGLWLYRVVP